MPDVFAAIQNGTAFRTTIYDPNLCENVGLVLKSFQIGNSDQKMAILVGATESYIFREVKAITRFTIILAVIVFALSAIIIYFTFDNVTGGMFKGGKETTSESKNLEQVTRKNKENINFLAREISRFKVTKMRRPFAFWRFWSLPRIA